MKIIGVTYKEEEQSREAEKQKESHLRQGNSEMMLKGDSEMMLKGDSALLVNRKPFFVPDETKEPVAYPALALRICRLGKQIGLRFADRYFDAITPALDIQAADMLREARRHGASWTRAVSQDGSLPIGEWKEAWNDTVTVIVNHDGAQDELSHKGEQDELSPKGEQMTYRVSVEMLREAVCMVSRTMTIRQGDVVYAQLASEPLTLHLNDCLTARIDGDEQERLFCRIK